MDFGELLDKGADFLARHNEFTLVGHADADGICACAILQRTLDELGKRHETQWLDQVSTLGLENISSDRAVVFVDMGSAHLEEIERLFGDNDVMIIDHHQAGETELLLVNPELSGLDGTSRACSATVAFEIASRLTDTEQLAPLVLVGAQGDNQEPFEGYNKTVLDACVKRRQVTMREGARLFGVQSKPLVPLIAYSYDLNITGVTKDQDGAERLLEELDLADKRYYGQLSEEERELLDETLIRRSKNPEPEITFYTLEGMPRGPLRDTREAANLLNACGRIGKPDLAVEVMLKRDSRRAVSAHREYRGKIREAHEWYRSEEREPKDGLLVLDAGKNIAPNVAGVLCSSLSRGRKVPPETVVVCLAHYGDGTTKVSSRTLESEHDLSEVMSVAAKAVGGEGGGHDCAAGAIIPTEKEDAFIEHVREVLSSRE